MAMFITCLLPPAREWTSNMSLRRSSSLWGVTELREKQTRANISRAESSCGMTGRRSTAPWCPRMTTHTGTQCVAKYLCAHFATHEASRWLVFAPHRRLPAAPRLHGLELTRNEQPIPLSRDRVDPNIGVSIMPTRHPHV